MQYQCLRWIHNYDDDPVLIYSELDEQRWEKRKVEVYRDGTKGYADVNEEVGDTFLGEVPWPSIDEFKQETEFEASEITRDAFESAWAARKERGLPES